MPPRKEAALGQADIFVLAGVYGFRVLLHVGHTNHTLILTTLAYSGRAASHWAWSARLHDHHT